MKLQKIMALYLLTLVLTLPFYSANALAANVKITKNTGDQQIPGFIDAISDTWIVEATITGLEEIDPNEVKIRVGTGEDAFTSCADGPSGKVCKYVSPLPDGIVPDEYIFQVIAPDNSSDSSSVQADGAAPKIENLKATLQDGKVFLQFSATDDAVGLEKVEIIDADTGKVIADTTEEQYSEELPDVFTGEGTKRLKIKAADRLGHTSTRITSFSGDFIQPKIQNLTLSLGKFRGEFTATTDISIDVVETTQPVVSIDNIGDAACVIAGEVWRCTFKDAKLEPTISSLTVRAVDTAGNAAERNFPLSLVLDKDTPEVLFFGTRVFDGKHFIKPGANTILLQAQDKGAGINFNDVAINLEAFGQGGFATGACSLNTTVTCLWDASYSGSQDSVFTSITRLQDRVGNAPPRQDLELHVDRAAPVVKKISIEAEDHDYIQSKDPLKITLEVEEANGLFIQVDLNQLVTDAESKVTTSPFSPPGWHVFTENDCERKNSTWECSLITPSIRSGPDSNVPLEIKVQDTAGNDATWQASTEQGKEGQFFIDILGIQDEENPDYWSTGKITPLTRFLDLDTVHLTHARAAYKIDLETTSSAQLLDVNLGSCVAGKNTPKISRALVYGGESNSPIVVVEFSPFDGKKHFDVSKEKEFDQVTTNITCTLLVNSQLQNNVIASPEAQRVELDVAFAFTRIGALDENLASMIKKEREAVTTGIASVWGTLVTVVDVLDVLVQAYQIIVNVINLYKVAQKGFDAMKVTPPTEAARIAQCFGFNVFEQTVDKKVTAFIDVPLQVMTCRPTSSNWYGRWHQTLLRLYNLDLLSSPRAPLGSAQKAVFPARNIRDNLFLSVAGLCVPGIIKGLDNFRQVSCRKIYCLENEVVAGVATVNTCNELYGLMLCKYVLGELWYALPFVQVFDTIVNTLKNAVRDPIAVAHTATLAICGTSCLVSNTLNSGCTTAYYIWEVIGVIEQVVGAVFGVSDRFFSDTGVDYCAQVLNVKKPTPKNATQANSPTVT